MSLFNKQFTQKDQLDIKNDNEDLASYPTNQYLVGPTQEEKDKIKEKYRDQLEMIKNSN